jgi:hypothetical protein
MLTMVITRPPSTYNFILSLQFYSILEKLYSLLLHVESNKFLVLLKFLSCCYSCCCCRKERVTTIATGVVGGSFTFLTTNQAGTNEVGTPESRCQNFFLSPILFLSSSCWVKKKKKKPKTLQRNVGRSYSALLDITATLRGPMRCRSNVALLAIAATLRGPARCWPSQQRCEVQRVAGHRSNVARSSALLQ